jgi:hypothetical protein
VVAVSLRPFFKYRYTPAVVLFIVFYSEALEEELAAVLAEVRLQRFSEVS